MLTNEQFDKWIAELKSGNYKQGIGNLKLKGDNQECKYCCLGVLAETLAPNFETLADGIIRNEFGDELLNEDILPEEFQTTVAAMNDDEEMPFEEIADWLIERKNEIVKEN